MFKLVVLFSVVALAAAKPSVVAPLAYNAAVAAPFAYSAAVAAPLAYNAAVPAVSSVSQYSSSVVHGSPVYGAPVIARAYGPAVVPALAALAQPPHSPAVVLDPVNGVPLDTPEVVAARAAHFQAKALSGLHHLKKRSIAPIAYSSVVAPVAYSSPVVSAYSAPLVSAYSAPVVSAYSAPLVSPYAYSAVVPRALSVHPW